jgi:hypothetical protein
MAPPRRANPPLLATARAGIAAFLVLLTASILLLASPAAAACANFTPTPFAIKLGVLLSGDSDSKRVANAISLALSDAAAANSSLPVHLGTVGDSISALPTALIDGCAQGVPSTTANAAALSLKQSLANVCWWAGENSHFSHFPDHLFVSNHSTRLLSIMLFCRKHISIHRRSLPYRW